MPTKAMGMFHTKHHSFYTGMLLLLISILLVACSTTPDADTNSPTDADETTIRLGYVPVIIFAPIYVGIERGYFAEEGLTIDLTALQSTNDAVIQLAAGNFEVAAAGGNAGVFNAIERGLEFKIVAPMHSEAPPLATPLVISANRTDEIQTIADLAGKRVAINGNGAAIEYWMAQALAQGGLSMDDVEVTAMPFPNMPAALENGSLDAAVISEPLVTINVDNGLLSILSEDYIDGFTATFLFMSQSWSEQNPEAARGFMRAYLHACRDLQGDYMTPEIATIIETYTEVPAPIIERSKLAQYDPNGVVPVEDLQTLQTFFMGRGSLEYEDLLDIDPFVDTDLATEVAAELDQQ